MIWHDIEDFAENYFGYNAYVLYMIAELLMYSNSFKNGEITREEFDEKVKEFERMLFE